MKIVIKYRFLIKILLIPAEILKDFHLDLQISLNKVRKLKNNLIKNKKKINRYKL